MKPYIVICLLLIATGSVFADDFLPEGRYIFTCSKLYSGLCDISETNGVYQMLPIEKNRRGYIRFSRTWTGNLKIEDSGMGSSEVALSLSGKAKRRSDGSFAGRMRLTSYAIPLIPGHITWAKWSLRPTTKNEIHDGFVKGLEAASRDLWIKRKATQTEEERIFEALLDGRNEGYSHDDVPQLQKWYHDGILTVSSNKFVLNRANHGLESTGAPPAAGTPETHP